MRPEKERTLLEELQQTIDSERILTSPEDCVSYGFDASFGAYTPDAVVQACSTDEVVTVMKLANKYLVPVYPRGQGTSLSGGLSPLKEASFLIVHNGTIS